MVSGTANLTHPFYRHSLGGATRPSWLFGPTDRDFGPKFNSMIPEPLGMIPVSLSIYFESLIVIAPFSSDTINKQTDKQRNTHTSPTTIPLTRRGINNTTIYKAKK